MKLWCLSSRLRAKAMQPSPKLDYGTYYRRFIKYLRGEDTLVEPIVYYAEASERPFDFLSSTMFLTLLSPRVAGAIEGAELTGVRLSPVRILIDDGSELEGYRALRVTGRCAPLIPLKDVRRGQASQGVRVDPASHDGSDFVIPPADKGNAYILVTARARKVLTSVKPTNMLLRPIEEIEYYPKGYL